MYDIDFLSEAFRMQHPKAGELAETDRDYSKFITEATTLIVEVAADAGPRSNRLLTWLNVILVILTVALVVFEVSRLMHWK
jgi:hypothetical protein